MFKMSPPLSLHQAKTYLVHIYSLRLSRPLLRELCTYIGCELCPCVVSASLTLYNPHSHLSTHHSLPIHFTSGCSYVLLSPFTLLCLGGDPASKTCYSLDLASLKLTLLPQCQFSRCGAGVVKMRDTVYVFGGLPDMFSIESWSLSTNDWRCHGQMGFPRAYFTPCVFGVLIYLIDFSPVASHKVEIFHPKSVKTSTLSITFPDQMKSCTRIASVTFAVHDEICILTSSRQVAYWKVEQERYFRYKVTDRDCSSSQPPLIHGNYVLVANQCSGRVERWSAASHAFC